MIKPGYRKPLNMNRWAEKTKYEQNKDIDRFIKIDLWCGIILVITLIFN